MIVTIEHYTVIVNTWSHDLEIGEVIGTTAADAEVAKKYGGMAEEFEDEDALEEIMDFFLWMFSEAEDDAVSAAEPDVEQEMLFAKPPVFTKISKTHPSVLMQTDHTSAFSLTASAGLVTALGLSIILRGLLIAALPHVLRARRHFLLQAQLSSQEPSRQALLYV
jgi:hypothetical protein